MSLNEPPLWVQRLRFERGLQQQLLLEKQALAQPQPQPQLLAGAPAHQPYDTTGRGWQGGFSGLEGQSQQQQQKQQQQLALQPPHEGEGGGGKKQCPWSCDQQSSLVPFASGQV
jgi:hypothetical protein